MEYVANAGQDAGEMLEASPAAADEQLDMQELIDTTPDLHDCPQHRAIMICAATGTWDALLEIYPELGKDPLKAFAMLNDTEYDVMKSYFTQRQISNAVHEADTFWD